eukprot:3017365-Lingulodinium_polyedra.AAC.1
MLELVSGRKGVEGHSEAAGNGNPVAGVCRGGVEAECGGAWSAAEMECRTAGCGSPVAGVSRGG